MESNKISINTFDLHANLIYKNIFTLSQNEQQLEINLKNKIRRGIYFVIFSSKDLAKPIRHRFFVEY